MKKVVGCLMALVMCLSACTSSSNLTYEFKEDMILEYDALDYSVQATSITFGKENKVPYMELTVDVVNDNDETLYVEVLDVSVKGKDVPKRPDWDYEEDFKVRSEKSDTWVVRASGEGMDTMESISFELSFDVGDPANQRWFDFTLTRTDKKSYEFEYEETTSEYIDVVTNPPTQPDEPNTPPVTPPVPTPTTPEGGYGNDSMGFIQLNNDWHEELMDGGTQNPSKKSWIKGSLAGEYVRVTLGHDTDDISSVMSDLSFGSGEKEYARIPGSDYELMLCMRGYDPGILQMISVFTVASKPGTTYYLICEGSSRADWESFITESIVILMTHSEFAKTQALLDSASGVWDKYLAGTPDEPSTPTQPTQPTNPPTTGKQDGEYTIYEWGTTNVISTVNALNGYYLDTELSGTDKCVQNKNDDSVFIWVHGFPNDDILYWNQYKTYDASQYSFYKGVNVRELATETLADGRTATILEFSLTGDGYTTVRYEIGVHSSSKVGVSMSMDATDFQKTGFATPMAMVHALFD